MGPFGNGWEYTKLGKPNTTYDITPQTTQEEIYARLNARITQAMAGNNSMGIDQLAKALHVDEKALRLQLEDGIYKRSSGQFFIIDGFVFSSLDHPNVVAAVGNRETKPHKSIASAVTTPAQSPNAPASLYDINETTPAYEILSIAKLENSETSIKSAIAYITDLWGIQENEEYSRNKFWQKWRNTEPPGAERRQKYTKTTYPKFHTIVAHLIKIQYPIKNFDYLINCLCGESNKVRYEIKVAGDKVKINIR
jgi:hypothetical protein